MIGDYQMKYKQNMILKTRDGRKVGNAKIIQAKKADSKHCYGGYVPTEECYRIRTDIGINLIFSEEMIDELFYPPYFQLGTKNKGALG